MGRDAVSGPIRETGSPAQAPTRTWWWRTWGSPAVQEGSRRGPRDQPCTCERGAAAHLCHAARAAAHAAPQTTHQDVKVREAELALRHGLLRGCFEARQGLAALQRSLVWAAPVALCCLLCCLLLVRCSLLRCLFPLLLLCLGSCWGCHAGVPRRLERRCRLSHPHLKLIWTVTAAVTAAVIAAGCLSCRALLGCQPPVLLLLCRCWRRCSVCCCRCRLGGRCCLRRRRCLCLGQLRWEKWGGSAFGEGETQSKQRGASGAWPLHSFIMHGPAQRPAQHRPAPASCERHAPC